MNLFEYLNIKNLEFIRYTFLLITSEDRIEIIYILLKNL